MQFEEDLRRLAIECAENVQRPVHIEARTIGIVIVARTWRNGECFEDAQALSYEEFDFMRGKAAMMKAINNIDIIIKNTPRTDI